MGATITLRDLNRPTAVTFVALDCDDACAISEALFARLARTLAREHVDARLRQRRRLLRPPRLLRLPRKSSRHTVTG